MPTKLFSAGDLENLRLAKILVEDMGLNMAGVEVILNMLDKMTDLQKENEELGADIIE